LQPLGSGASVVAGVPRRGSILTAVSNYQKHTAGTNTQGEKKGERERLRERERDSERDRDRE